MIERQQIKHWVNTELLYFIQHDGLSPILLPLTICLMHMLKDKEIEKRPLRGVEVNYKGEEWQSTGNWNTSFLNKKKNEGLWDSLSLIFRTSNMQGGDSSPNSCLLTSTPSLHAYNYYKNNPIFLNDMKIDYWYLNLDLNKHTSLPDWWWRQHRAASWESYVKAFHSAFVSFFSPRIVLDIYYVPCCLHINGDQANRLPDSLNSPSTE